MDSITSGAIDIYAEFGVAPTASTREISKRFRLLALKFHPDKNPDPTARDKFHLFSLIHSVLSDALLRQQYDRVRQDALSVNARPDSEILDQIVRFRQQLRAQEARERARAHEVHTDVRLEKLRLEGLSYRRNFQKLREVVRGYVSFRDLPQDGPVTALSEAGDGRLVTVTWKVRTEPGAQINGQILEEIMAVFGTVADASVKADDGRYCSGVVSFSSDEGATQAVSHDYRKSASLWDGRGVRKLASLLRSCKRTPSGACWEDEYAEKLFQGLDQY